MATQSQSGPRGRGGPPAAGRPRGRRYYPPRRRVCSFCVNKVKLIDYKDVATLRRYVSSDTANMETRRRSGNCARHQRRLAHAIKRARLLALLPLSGAHVRATGWRE